MEQIPWYKSAIIRQQIVQLIVAVTAIIGVKTDINWDETTSAIFAGVAAVIAVVTLVTRLFKPHPPVTATAAKKEVETQAKLAAQNQGGFVRLSVLIVIALLSVGGAFAVSSMQGCTHTQEAYHEAKGNLSDTLYVTDELYASLVHQAADLKERKVISEDWIAQLQAVDKKGNDALHHADDLRKALAAGGSAATQEELQRAVDDAIRIIADFARKIHQSKGEQA